MTQEEKELLLKDLCARLLYGVKVQHQHQDYLNEVQTIEIISKKYGEIETESVLGFVDDFKPYLFPLSSMTEEQKEELFKLCEFCIREDWEGRKSEVYAIEIASRPDPVYCYDHTFRMWGIDMRTIDWLLKNHFDIYGLIPMDLAIDATGKNIY